MSPEEFERVLRYGLAGKSTGVMMFTIGSVTEDPGKMAAMKRVYREGSGHTRQHTALPALLSSSSSSSSS
ncbi:MAG: hypothetical protein ACYDBB_23825 [Armatimonadota bacterium]